MDEENKMYRVLVGKPKGKRQLGRPRHVWEDEMRMGDKLGWIGFSWLNTGQVTGSCEHGDEPLSSGTTQLVKR
jgi:hypothetical protein